MDSKLRKIVFVGLAIVVYTFFFSWLIIPTDFFMHQRILMLLLNAFLTGLIFVGINFFWRNDEKWMLSFSLFSSSILSPVLVWFIAGNTEYGFLSFFIGFVVLAAVPAFIYYVYSHMNNNQPMYSIGGEREKNTDALTDRKSPLFELKSDAGKVLLAIEVNKIICFEANDNYVTTYYLDNLGELKKSFERFSLKQIETILSDLPYEFLRVHRSYIINPAYVSRVSGRSQAYKLNMKYFDKEIPVSRSFNLEQISI